MFRHGTVIPMNIPHRKLKGCYCVGSPYKNISTEAMVQQFIEEFNGIAKCSPKKYNKHRKTGIPTWECVARRVGASSWLGLCSACGVESISSKTNNLPIVVMSYTLTEKRLTAIDDKYKNKNC